MELANPSEVTLRDLSGCSVVLRFNVEPGSDHVVRFAPDGSATVVEDRGGLDTVPRLELDGSAACSEPPDTSTDGSPNPVPASPWAPLTLVALAAGFVIGVRRFVLGR